MAILAGFPRGKGPVELNGTAIAALTLGSAGSIVIAAASVALALPTDTNGNLYTAYVLIATGPAWVNFNTAGDAAVAGAANTYLVGSFSPIIVEAPPTATQISGIMDSAGAGKVNVVGLY
jgi:hypothetical protein